MEIEYYESFVAYSYLHSAGYVFPKNIACCLNYSNQMLSNIKLILGCLCPVSQPQRLSAEQMDSIN